MHLQEKKKKKYKICYALGQNLPYGPNLFYFHQGMVRTMKWVFTAETYIDDVIIYSGMMMP